ncbi:conserved hypothetical protein [Desulforamulus hydrothermalis Lam5 = DSM 18033]|uniref:Uncharacterized protein n=1 Tax=Desulforamulus hydrothermalis Lam5 = DSM 18033 TaxID=1121428 RepID=K8EBR9_9FIRM|nr:conserved hypothetical protein [Desulforamulus hydrothermalis Lam5 = DSM 18033]SHH11959.1 hypothetical protein SAMN02745177_01514 [Desulforamulus hydrothermalis Lam5 = DSM 18033]
MANRRPVLLDEVICLKTWYVEDAGGGCRAFGEVLVLVCEETNEVYAARVPVTWSNKMGWEELVCQLMIDLMAAAGAGPADRYLVCSGNIFHTYHKWLTEHGYNWATHKMDGLAHEAAENEFHRMVVEAGFPAHIKLVDRDYRSYYNEIEKWVASDPARQQLYWKDREVRKKPAQARYVLKSTLGRARTCRHCRQPIPPFSPAVELKYRQNGRKFRYFFHPACSPVQPLQSRLEQLTVPWQGGQLTGILIPCQDQVTCALCGLPLASGEPTFYAYAGSQLLAGHPACFAATRTSGGLG